jgi:hypothetical protein
MKDTPTLPDTKPSALDYIKQSALEYIINYLFDGLETCERNPATDDFELGYEQALHDTMVDLCCREGRSVPRSALRPKAFEEDHSLEGPSCAFSPAAHRTEFACLLPAICD